LPKCRFVRKGANPGGGTKVKKTLKPLGIKKTCGEVKERWRGN